MAREKRGEGDYEEAKDFSVESAPVVAVPREPAATAIYIDTRQTPRFRR